MKTPKELIERFGPRESMDYDVVIVGAGPAGLAAAIRLKQQAQAAGRELSVCVIEKGAEPGAHILSGAVFDPRALAELLPDFAERGAPLGTPALRDRFLLLGRQRALDCPTWLLPACFQNHGNHILSLGTLVRWLAQQAEQLGVEIFPGFAATEVLTDASERVIGVATGHMGLDKSGQPTAGFQLGMELRAKYTLFAEGARGHLGQQLRQRFELERFAQPQSYAIGIKELWQVAPECHREGEVMHTAGWPLDNATYGGSFLYHGAQSQVMVGFVVGLAYRNPYLSPFDEFQRFKTHPAVRGIFKGAKRVGYGARVIAAGGLASLPRLVFPGGALLGCDAGFLNASRIKGAHAAMKSGMLCAESVFEALGRGEAHTELHDYPERFRNSWLFEELHRARNFKQWMSRGLWGGSLMVGLEQKLLGGHVPWSLAHQHRDDETLLPAKDCKPIDYPAPDGVLSFDRLSSVYLANVGHSEDQPVHLMLKDASVPVALNLARYAGPEQRYCPAGVYEFEPVPAAATVDSAQADSAQADKPVAMRLRINASNCVHCKTCDIKDPTRNIVWVAPEGGGGPNYVGM